MTTDAHLQAVAYLVEAITDGRWHRPGIMAALRDIPADRPLWLIARAAVTAAATRSDQHSPAVIAKPGPHWADPATSTAAPHPQLSAFPADAPKAAIDPAVIKRLRHAAGHHTTRPDPTCPDCPDL